MLLQTLWSAFYQCQNAHHTDNSSLLALGSPQSPRVIPSPPKMWDSLVCSPGCNKKIKERKEGRWEGRREGGREGKESQREKGKGIKKKEEGRKEARKERRERRREGRRKETSGFTSARPSPLFYGASVAVSLVLCLRVHLAFLKRRQNR